VPSPAIELPFGLERIEMCTLGILLPSVYRSRAYVCVCTCYASIGERGICAAKVTVESLATPRRRFPAGRIDPSNVALADIRRARNVNAFHRRAGKLWSPQENADGRGWSDACRDKSRAPLRCESTRAVFLRVRGILSRKRDRIRDIVHRLFVRFSFSAILQPTG